MSEAGERRVIITMCFVFVAGVVVGTAGFYRALFAGVDARAMTALGFAVVAMWLGVRFSPVPSLLAIKTEL